MSGSSTRDGDEGDRLRLLHLAFHKVLCDDPISGAMYGPKRNCRFLCAVPAIEEEDAINVAIDCRGIARHRPQLPYGLSDNDDGCFEVTEERAELRLPEERKWLNGSTFVLTVFKSAGPKLVDPADWPDRPEEDRRWQAKRVQWLWPEAGCRYIRRSYPTSAEPGFAPRRPRALASNPNCRRTSANASRMARSS